MDLRAVKAATQSELAQCAVAAATNAQALVADAELLAGRVAAADEAAGSVGLARQATTSAGGLILASQFQTWLTDPPAEALDTSEDLVTTLTEADARTSDAAANVIHRTVERFTARRE